MPSNQLHFFATMSDLDRLMKAIESERSLQYVKGGLLDTSKIESFHSWVDVLSRQSEHDEETLQQIIYLLSDREGSIECRKISQRDGGTRFAVDQLNNPRTISLQPGGKCGDHCLLAGHVGTASGNIASIELFKQFRSKIRQQFAKVKLFYVDKQASELLAQGWRLTTNVKSPSTYDLTRD